MDTIGAGIGDKDKSGIPGGEFESIGIGTKLGEGMGIIMGDCCWKNGTLLGNGTFWGWFKKGVNI